MGLLIIIVLLLQILNNERQEHSRPVTPERLPQDRTSAKLFYRILFLVIGTAFYFHADWSMAAPNTPSRFEQAISAMIVFYIFVCIPLWICVEMEHKDFVEMNKK